VIKRKSGESVSIAVATVKFFIFDAGIKYFSAFCSKMTFPVLSETALKPTVPRRTSGRETREAIFARSSASVAVFTAGGVGEGVAATGSVTTTRGRGSGVDAGSCPNDTETQMHIIRKRIYGDAE